MSTSQNRFNTKLAVPTKVGGGVGNVSKNNTAKQSYTSLRYGNDHGSINFGHLHKNADVTAGVMLQAFDSRHSLILDNDGPRKGCTQLTAPGRIVIESGKDLKETEETLFIHSWNGNIAIIASNGKLRLQGTDVEIIAVGEGGSKGNVRIDASENIELKGKKVQVDASALYKLASPGMAQIVANDVMEIYAPIIRGVTDAVANRDSKVGGKAVQKENNK